MIARLGDVRWLARWIRRHPRWCGGWLVLIVLAARFGFASPVTYAVIGGAPIVLCFVWHAASPPGYERFCAGPSRRLGWQWRVRTGWKRIAERCRLCDRVQVTVRTREGRRIEHKLVSPRLRKVRTSGHRLELTLRARAGQTIDDIDEAAPRIASTLGAVSVRTRPVAGRLSGCTTVVELVMADALTTPVVAGEPLATPVVDALQLGRTQGGGNWWFRLRGRHTLVAGCSGSGKGSVLWGICCGLAPALKADVVRLWGVDLKRGVELEMGSGLFSAHAYKPADALGVLKSLMAVIDKRGAAMAGQTRLHTPTPGDPLHVLVIDELAALTAYADFSIRRDAERLLSEILTQGRALGVVVVACVQDPRKDVVAMRGLFTQTVALRLRSSEETAMVLGDGMTHAAPAHRISPSFPGTAWIVEDAGAVDRVRADYWTDDLIRDTAERYATGVRLETTPAEPDEQDDEPIELRPRRKRSPRASTRGGGGEAA